MISRIKEVKKKSKEIFANKKVKYRLGFLGFSDVGLTVARARYTDGRTPMIIFDTLFFIFAPDKFFFETLLHEIAHIIEFQKHPETREDHLHTEAWRQIAMELGIENPTAVTDISNDEALGMFLKMEKFYLFFKKVSKFFGGVKHFLYICFTNNLKNRQNGRNGRNFKRKYTR